MERGGTLWDVFGRSSVTVGLGVEARGEKRKNEG